MFKETKKEYGSINFDKNLLNPKESLPSFEASLNAHGKYETLKFVLSLSPRVHELIDELTDGDEIKIKNPTQEHFEAYSTYIHETIHWWQHIGSTSGLLLSVSYPAITFINFSILQEIIAEFGLKKPLKKWADEILLTEGEAAQKKLSSVNTVVNNTLDIHFYQHFATTPKKAAECFGSSNNFESLGHTYHMAYSQLNRVIATTFDQNFDLIPHPREWQIKFKELNKRKYEGFYYGSPLRIAPIGLHAIYEGQAKFIQLQFLTSIFSNVSFNDWIDSGHLFGVYLEAFNYFLELSESAKPESIDDPIAALFLLICDLAINPSKGFPLKIVNYESFIQDVDVGIRFSRLCTAVKHLPELREYIKLYSYEEYLYVSSQLTSFTDYDNPIKVLTELVSWLDSSPELCKMMDEYTDFTYDKTNLPLRVLFSHFLAFTKDKLSNPEFFCWTGKWMVAKEESISKDLKNLWLRHLSLFCDRPDKRGVYPRLWPNRDEKNIQEMFKSFYSLTSLYDLTNQWILDEGEFKFDYYWLSANHDITQVKEWANNSFKQLYGKDLCEFDII